MACTRTARKSPLPTAMLLLALTASAHAGHFTVSPVRVSLDGQARTELLTVTNRSAKTIQLQIQPTAWAQTPDGRDALTPTQELLTFPTLFELAPGAHRIVRVGTLHAPSEQEQSFRLLITELPDADALQSTNAISMRLRLSVPVFLTPRGAQPAPELVPPQVAGGQARAALRNPGTAHTKARAVRLVAEGADGHVLFEQALSAWYVLAASERVYAVNLPPDACAAVRRLVLSVETGDAVLRTTTSGPFDCLGAP